MFENPFEDPQSAWIYVALYACALVVVLLTP